MRKTQTVSVSLIREDDFVNALEDRNLERSQQLLEDGVSPNCRISMSTAFALADIDWSLKDKRHS